MEKVDCGPTVGHNFLQLGAGNNTPDHAFLSCTRCGTVLDVDLKEGSIKELTFSDSTNKGEQDYARSVRA
jgi:Fe2+ or Zn2+ uptake regulation protein